MTVNDAPAKEVPIYSVRHFAMFLFIYSQNIVQLSLAPIVHACGNCRRGDHHYRFVMRGRREWRANKRIVQRSEGCIGNIELLRLGRSNNTTCCRDKLGERCSRLSNCLFLQEGARLQLGLFLLHDARKEFLDLCDGQAGIEALRTSLGAVHDRVAPVNAERVGEALQSFLGLLVTRVDDPSVGLHEYGRSQVLVTVPPVRRTRRRATGAHNALIQTVQLGTVLHRLQQLRVALLLCLVPESDVY